MSDIFASTLFVFVVYCAWAIAIHQPRPAIESQPINYFPEEVEEETEPEPQPIVIVERRPIAAFTVPVATVPSVDLSALGVRDLYKLAADAGHKNVKKMSKAALIELLK